MHRAAMAINQEPNKWRRSDTWEQSWSATGEHRRAP